MTVSINGSSGIVFNDASTQNTSPFTGGFAMRNRIINGAMVIDQRNAGASVTPANGVMRVEDGALIPFSLDNRDYQAYLAWVAEGNQPEPADEVAG